MGTSTKLPQSGQTIERDGMLWKPKRGSTATAEEFFAARARFAEVHADARWNGSAA